MKISWGSVKRSLRYCDFRLSVLISGGHLGFWSEPKLDWCLLCSMMVWSFRENFVMIGETVSDILWFKCFALISGRHLWFSLKPEVDCFFWFLVMAWGFCENFVTIDQTVVKILRFSNVPIDAWPQFVRQGALEVKGQDGFLMYDPNFLLVLNCDFPSIY